MRAIGVSHTACKDEFRRNLRSHSCSSVFSFFIIYIYIKIDFFADRSFRNAKKRRKKAAKKKLVSFDPIFFFSRHCKTFIFLPTSAIASAWSIKGGLSYSENCLDKNSSPEPRMKISRKFEIAQLGQLLGSRKSIARAELGQSTDIFVFPTLK